ncbi:hypothetical protein [Bdellovibrio reynosensis]|uniref:Flp pilus assembly protein RcpC/CpaB domain-containing protein n=1 Tax=Bdellovibrio reynosensis TaxID=2835041 RepID=A0ABY4CBA5_9BACT|nr:hypothetical protein [Bdellovibrio reynosensis]UOF00961.1 hypothetical protein MNR06_14765 [Bdellovibrio reynosensis]
MGEKLFQFVKKNLLVIAFIVMGIASWIASSNQTPENQVETTFHNQPTPRSVDTYIPKGLALITIDIANAEGLSSLIGDQGGVVDLYLATTEKQKGGLKVAEKVKLMRAPLNPDLFAVLIKASEGPKLLSYQGPFIAVVQNPNEKGSLLPATVSAKSKIRVDYQN